MKKVIFQKADLDTCLTAFLMGITSRDNIRYSIGEASESDLNNAGVICIEAGGSGMVSLNNFDHHNIELYLPPACRQALSLQKENDPDIIRLVDYASMIDEPRGELLFIEFPSLSNLFSGLLLTEKDPVEQFRKGVDLLQTVLIEKIDPFKTMPMKTEWQPYIQAKMNNLEHLKEQMKNVEYHQSINNLKIGFCQSEAIGGIQFMYDQGCQVVIMFNPRFGQPPIPKFTIAGNNINVFKLITSFDKLEKGWGGRDTILGSPRKGTAISKELVIKIVREYL